MADHDEGQSWASAIVRLAFYVVLGLAVGYAIIHFWPQYFDLSQPH